MEFVIEEKIRGLEKTKTFSLRLKGNNFTEDWVLFADLLGYDNPVDFVNYIYKFTSSNIERIYRQEDNRLKIVGLDVFFTNFSECVLFREIVEKHIRKEV